jgi:hypothetical protein
VPLNTSLPTGLSLSNPQPLMASSSNSLSLPSGDETIEV